MNYKFLLFFLLVVNSLVLTELGAVNKYIVTFKHPNPVEEPVIAQVNTLSENENQIIWGEQNNVNLQHYNVYRNSINEDIGWTLIGRVNYPDSSRFNDKNVYSNIQSYQYKVSAVDICADETFSSAVKTLKLNLDKRNDGTYILNWNSSNDIKLRSYVILKGSSFNHLNSIDSLSETNPEYIDNQNATITQYYRITSNALLADSVLVDKNKTNRIIIRSNIVSTLGDNIEDSDNTIKLYPNPLSSYSIVALPYNPVKPYIVSIFDFTGKRVYNQTVYSDEFLLDRGNMKEGVYIIQVAGNRVYRKKIIIGQKL